MAVSDTQFQLNLAKEFFKLGGPLIQLSQDSTDIKRPLIQGRISQGFEQAYIGEVTVELTGIDLDLLNSLYSSDCYEYSCLDKTDPTSLKVFPTFDEAFLETTVDGISDICFSAWGAVGAPGGVRYGFVDMDLYPDMFSLGANPFCYEIYDKNLYRVRASSDRYSAVYLADIGYLNLIGGQFIPVEANIPFGITNKRSVITATSVKSIPAGIKVAFIKRVTSTTSTIVGVIYGEVSNIIYLPHNTLVPGRKIDYPDQSILLEDLSINLLLLNTFTKAEGITNQTIFRNRYFSDPLFELTTGYSARVLSQLINTEEGIDQFGSIPNRLATFSRDQTEYNNTANNNYAQETITCFDNECFESDCFTEFINDTLINRAIDNRALSWTLLYLSSYLISVSDSQDSRIDVQNILFYLRDQITPLGLYYYGWKDLDTTGPYSTLTLDTEVRCSTQCAIFMAYLKGFEVTQDFSYIEYACALLTNINKYFLNKDNLYVFSTTDKRPSVESVTYQLLISIILEDYEHIDEIVAFFESHINPLPTDVTNNVVVGGDNVILTGLDNVVVTPSIQLNTDMDYSLFTPTDADIYTTRADIFKYNYLAYSSLLNIARFIPISNLSVLEEKFDFIYDTLINNRDDASLTFILSSLTNNNSFLNSELSTFHTAPEIHNLKFTREALFQQLLGNIPTDYEWFRPEVLDKSSNLGKIMNSVAFMAARDNVWNEYLSRIGYIDGMYGILLNQKARDIGLTRFPKESDAELKIRIKFELIHTTSTVASYENAFELLDSPVSIKDNTAIIAGVEDLEEDIFVDKWGIGYLQGFQTAGTNIATLLFNQPIETDVFQDIGKYKPAGIGLLIVENIPQEVTEFSISVRITDIVEGCEHLTLEDNDAIEDNEDAFTQEDGSLFCLEEEESGVNCNNIDLQTSDDVLTENNDRICLEDDDTVMPGTITGYVPDPPDPPAPTEATCDCEGLRGYITINTVPTELRNMRTFENPPGTFFWDVNATNETVEPCDLAITDALSNNAQVYLELTSVTLPTEIAGPRRIDYIFDDSATEQYYIWHDAVANQSYVSRVDPSAPAAPGTTTTLPAVFNNQRFTAINLPAHIVIVTGDELHTIDKGTLVVNSVFTIDATVTELAIYADSAITARIYSRQSSDDTIYHYSYNDGTDVLTALSAVLMTDTRTHNYIETLTGLVRYSANGTDIEVWSTPGFDELGTIANTLSPLDAGDEINHILSIDNFVYLGSSVAGVTFSDVDVYTNSGTLLQYKLNTSSVFDLQYLDANNANFYNTGQPYVLGNYLLFKGTNNVLGFSNNTLQALNNFICSSDVLTIPAGVTIQSIDPVKNNPDAVIVSAVDLLTPQWYIFQIEVKNKVCS